MISRGGKVEKGTKGVFQQCKFNSPRRVYRHVNMNGMNRIKAHVYGNNAKYQLKCRKNKQQHWATSRCSVIDKTEKRAVP